MDGTKLQRGEIIAAAGGVLLAISLFRTAYSPSDGPEAMIDGARSAVTAWEVHDVGRWLLLLAAAAPLVLAAVALRDRASWPQGEATAVVGMLAVVFLFYAGILDRPGEPASGIALAVGWYGMFLGAWLIAIGGAIRAAESERRRKPPGEM